MPDPVLVMDLRFTAPAASYSSTSAVISYGTEDFLEESSTKGGFSVYLANAKISVHSGGQEFSSNSFSYNSGARLAAQSAAADTHGARFRHYNQC